MNQNEYELFKEEVDKFIKNAKDVRTNIINEKKEEIVEEVNNETVEIKENDIIITNYDTEDEVVVKVSSKPKEKEKCGLKNKGLKMMLISGLFIPALFVLFVIGTHSDDLINTVIFFVVTFLFVISTMSFGYGFVLYLKNRKNKEKKLLKKVMKVLTIIFFSCYILGTSSFLFILYGPFNGFRDWLVTTAMSTMNHQYLCKWFYSEKEIKEVQSRNFVKEPEASTDPSLIGKEPEKEEIVYNEYEKQIMIHEEGEPYKIITFEVNGAKAYLAAIYDPSMISVEVTSQVGVIGEYVTKMAERNNAMLAINAGGFIDAGNNLGESPTGITIKNGQIITNNEYGEAVSTGGLIGFNEDNVLMLLKDTTAEEALNMGIRDAVSWGPFLIVNGESSTVSGNGGWGGGARSAIGQRKDGTVLFLVVDSNASRTTGAGMEDLVQIMENYGAYNAANLDGGTSSVMVLPRDIAINQFNARCDDYFTGYACAINDPIDAAMIHRTRYIATSFIVTNNQ